MKRNILGSFLIGLVVAGISACNGKKEEKKNLVLPVVVLATKTTDLYKHYVGDLNAYQNVEIRARVQGYLDKIYVDEGKEVKKGQLLFELSDKEFKAEVSRAEANLKTAMAQALSAKVVWERKKPLVDKGIISPSELSVAEADYNAINASIERAQSDLINAKAKLSYTFIRAPFDGTTDRNPYKVGSLINEGTLLTTLSDVSYINAYFNIPERDYIEYIKSKENKPEGAGDEVELILADGSFYPLKGNLEKKDGVFDENTGTMDFRARFPNPKKTLRHGSAGLIRITNPIKDALLVPQKATFEIQDKIYVFVVDTANRVRIQSFVAQKRFSDFYIVASGLKSGDRIVYEGIQKIKDGMQIVPRHIDFDSVTASPKPSQLTKKK